MDFLKCSIKRPTYGVGTSEVEIVAAKHMASEISDVWGRGSVFGSPEIELESGITFKIEKVKKGMTKGFNFEDDRLMQGNWMKEPNSNMIQMFFQILAVCHTAIPELDEETGSFTYEAESPDEGAFLVAARESGYEFCKRTQLSVFIREKYPSSTNPIE